MAHGKDGQDSAQQIATKHPLQEAGLVLLLCFSVCSCSCVVAHPEKLQFTMLL